MAKNVNITILSSNNVKTASVVHVKYIPCQVVPPNDLQNLAARWLHHGLSLDRFGQLGLGLPHQMSKMKNFPKNTH